MEATYLHCHCIPFPLAKSVSHDVVNFRCHKKTDDEDVDDDQVCIASMVKGCVICQVDIGGYDIAQLNAHCEVRSWMVSSIGDKDDQENRKHQATGTYCCRTPQIQTVYGQSQNFLMPMRCLKVSYRPSNSFTAI